MNRRPNASAGIRACPQPYQRRAGGQPRGEQRYGRDFAGAGVFNLTERWLGGLRSSFRERLSKGQDFCYINVGDSIATGTIGIPSKSQHYAAVAARSAAEHLGLPARSTLHTAADRGSDGRTLLSGRGWRIEEAGLYGGGSYVASAGSDGALHYLPDPGYRLVRICHRGGFDYSVDGGASGLAIIRGR